MSEMDPQAVRAILASRKYSGLAPELVRRVVRECLARSGPRAAEKTARRKLHQVTGAYADPGLLRSVTRCVSALADHPDPEDPGLRAICREALAAHASTAERLGHLEAMYAEVRVFLGESPARILDLGAGLGPFALPWLGLPAATEYHAVDVDRRLAELQDRLLQVLGRPGSAVAADLVGSPPPRGPWDAVLLLKLLPTLDRQRPGAAATLVRSLDTPRLVISYATVSLGGHRKGMDEQYARAQAALEQDCGLVSRRLVYSTETVYLSLRR